MQSLVASGNLELFFSQLLQALDVTGPVVPKESVDLPWFVCVCVCVCVYMCVCVYVCVCVYCIHNCSIYMCSYV